MLPTLWEYMYFGGFLGALRVQGWRKYVILRVSVWGMCIFYWIFAAKIWEYMSFGGFLGALRAQGWEMYIFGHFFTNFNFCPQSRMSSKSHVLKVACPQSRVLNVAVLNVACPQCPIGLCLGH